MAGACHQVLTESVSLTVARDHIVVEAGIVVPGVRA